MNGLVKGRLLMFGESEAPPTRCQTAGVRARGRSSGA
jgi:hypothetical protein